MMSDAGATENDCDDIAGIPGKVEGCVVSLVIREMGDKKCKVSVRSQKFSTAARSAPVLAAADIKWPQAVR